MLPIHFHVPLHGDYRHAERLHNFFRPHGPSHDHLTREHPEAPYICLLVLKHRQVSVHITNLAVLGFYRDPIVNLGHSGWKDWQLQLWHASSYQPFATAATIFWLILISSTPRKSPVRSGCLKLRTANVVRGQDEHVGQHLAVDVAPQAGLDKPQPFRHSDELVDGGKPG